MEPLGRGRGRAECLGRGGDARRSGRVYWDLGIARFMAMKTTAAGLLVLVGCLLAAGPASAEFTLTIRDGMVTLVADNVSPRQILTEWARLGQTRVVNLDKLTGAPLTLRLENVPERQALDIVLRACSGFIVAERADYDPALSRFDRILVMPPSTVVAAGPAAGGGLGSRMAAPAAPYTPPVAPPPPTPPAEDAEPAEEESPSPYNDGRPPETNFDYANPQEFLRRRQEMMQQQQQQQPSGTPATFPGTASPYGTQPQPSGTPATPGALPTAPVSSARPGEIVTPPQPPTPTFVNPYGIPSNVAPGSQAAPPMQPDRAKYANPYQPTPPQPAV